MSRRAVRMLAASAAAGVFVVLGAALAPLAAQQASDTTSQCVVCHTTERVALTDGIHAQHGITCVTCHGGDPTARALPAAHGGRFSGKLSKVATAQLCGSCHSDPNRMRQYNLPTDQLAQFRTSKHGQLLFQQHDDDAPTCTDCHEAHVIYPPDDARSRVYPLNIPGTCARCHSDTRLMAKYHLPTNQLAEFRNSAHGVALFQKQNFAAPTCIECHSAHSALPPQQTEIASVCGSCHHLVAQAFASGPHAAAVASGKLPACLGCHSNHGTERVPVDSIAFTCDKCHKNDTRIHQMGVDIQSRVVQATADLASAERAVGELSLAGRRVSDYEFRYQSALTSYLQIAQVQHSLDLSRLDELGRQVSAVSIELGAAAEVSAEQRWEHELILAPVWFLALSAMALGALALRGLKRSGGGDGSGSDTDRDGGREA
jgi:hypothetical protein